MMEDLTPEYKERKKREELRRIKELSDIRKVLSTAEGRRWFWKVMSRAKAFHSPYTGDTNQTMYNCGEQGIGFYLLAELLEASPATFTIMQREAKSEAKRQEDEDKQED